ncbi:MAG: amidohydrolase family protein [Planctomycetota bacterium]|jgi:DhnA family fructose-bisphosphate aldolase class Ia
MKTTRCTILLMAFILLMFTTSVFAVEKYDLVILNGRVMDPETMLDAMLNVGVKDGKIAVVTTKSIKGKETINAKAHVVAPGFIDHHVHADDEFGYKLLLRDGVTTPLEMEAGVYPVDEWYSLREGKCQVNYGATASHVGVRWAVFTGTAPSKGEVLGMLLTSHDNRWSKKVSTPKEMSSILAGVEEGLNQGALGVGAAIGYYGDGSSSIELYEAIKLAGKYGTAAFIHGRFSSQSTPVSGYLSFEEVIAAAAITDAGVVLQHFHQQSLADTKAAIRLFEDAQKRGLRVLGEVYPYNFGSTIAMADYLRPHNYGPNMGRTYKDIIEVSTGKPLSKERYDYLVKNAPGTLVLFYGSKEEDMLYALARPGITVGSDAMPSIRADGKPVTWDTPYDEVQVHPRAAGAHALVLRLSREKNLMPLMLAVSKMTYLPARFLQDNGVPQMAHKGRIQVGADADITIFDPKNVRDNSTMKDGGLPSTGIPYVIVNGTIVVKDSKVLKDVYPGKAIRLPVMK